MMPSLNAPFIEVEKEFSTWLTCLYVNGLPRSNVYSPGVIREVAHKLLLGFVPQEEWKVAFQQHSNIVESFQEGPTDNTKGWVIYQLKNVEFDNLQKLEIMKKLKTYLREK